MYLIILASLIMSIVGCSYTGQVVVNRNISKDEIKTIAKDLGSEFLDTSKFDSGEFELSGFFGGKYEIQNIGDSARVSYEYSKNSALDNSVYLNDKTKSILFPIVLKKEINAEFGEMPSEKSFWAGYSISLLFPAGGVMYATSNNPLIRATSGDRFGRIFIISILSAADIAGLGFFLTGNEAIGLGFLALPRAMNLFTYSLIWGREIDRYNNFNKSVKVKTNLIMISF